MLRWGILGTSFISNTVVTAIQRSPGSQVTAVFGRDEGRLTAFADKYGIERRFTSIDALLDDGSVDVVYVGLPSHMHASATIAAARRGKAILSEKSLATTMKDSQEMIQAVRDSGAFFLEGLMYLCHPLYEKVTEIIHSGSLGQIRSVEGHYSANIWKRANPLGKGTIYNLGCYPVSLLHLVMQTAFGPEAFLDRRVSGQGNISLDGNVRHVRDAALAVRFNGCGVLATIQSTDSFGSDFGFAIQGTEGTLRFKTNPWLPAAGADANVLEIVPRAKGAQPRTVSVGGEHDAFECQVRKVEEGVAGGLKEVARPAARWSDSLEIMALLLEWEDAILRE